MSLQQEADERRRRIAQLRAERKGNSQQSTPKPTELEDITKRETNKEELVSEQEGPESPEEHIESNNSKHEPSENSLKVFYQNGDTVEVIAQNIQDQILDKSRHIADMAAGTNVNRELKSGEKESGTSDLEKALEDQFEMARIRTDQAINRYLQQKYASQEEAK